MLTCLLAALPALAQAAAPVDCNNQTRHKTTCAGNTSTGTANCASFSFTLTVAGQSFTFSSPSSCDTGRREQDKDCYDCGPPSNGNHCKARGFKANVKIYSIGGGSPCPTIPDPLPTTLADASAAVQCKPLPKISDEDNWCASIRTRDTGEETPLTAGDDTLVLGDGRGARSRWLGRAFDLDWEHPVPGTELEEWLRALPREPVEALPAALQGALGEAAELEGAEVAGVLDVTYFRGGDPWITNRFDFSAFVGENGIHVREREFVPDEEGEFAARVESVIHDGRTLLVEGSGATGHAYLPGYYDLPAVLRARLGPYGLLESWLENPFGVHRLVGTSYAAFSDARGQPTVVETYPGIQGPGADGSAVYQLGGQVAMPRFESVEYRAGDGGTRLRRLFSAYSEVAEGVFRPGRIVETRYDSDGRLELTRSLHLRFTRAMSLAQARDRGWLAPSAKEWLVYQ